MIKMRLKYTGFYCFTKNSNALILYCTKINEPKCENVLNVYSGGTKYTTFKENSNKPIARTLLYLTSFIIDYFGTELKFNQKITSYSLTTLRNEIFSINERYSYR